MKAAEKTAEGTFEIRDIEDPKLEGPDWVKARIRVVGICGTDLRHWKVRDPKLEGHVMGHELAGEVVEVGPEVQNVKPGDRVVIESVMGDGTCEWCRIQHYNLCPNLYKVRTKYVSRAYAEYVVGPASKFYRLPDEISFEEAALIDTFSVCLHAQHLSGLKLNDTVAVIGAGPIGLGQLLLAKASGSNVIILDVLDSSLEIARELGADETVNSKKTDPFEAISEFTHGRGVDIAFECAGGKSMPTTLDQATKLTRRGGKVVIVGGFEDGVTTIPLEWQRIQMSEIKLIPSASFSFWGLEPEQGTVLDLFAKRRVDGRKMITHTFPLDRINEAFEVASNKETTGAIFVGLTL